MDVLITAFSAMYVGDDFLQSQAEALERIARERPDLVPRYNEAIALRDGPEIERIWFQCCIADRTLDSSVRINGITGELRFGYSKHTAPLCPPPS